MTWQERLTEAVAGCDPGDGGKEFAVRLGGDDYRPDYTLIGAFIGRLNAEPVASLARGRVRLLRFDFARTVLGRESGLSHVEASLTVAVRSRDWNEARTDQTAARPDGHAAPGDFYYADLNRISG